MAHGLLQVEVVAPERPLFRGDAGSLVAEACDGEMGILPGHAPLVALLGTGVLRIVSAGLKPGEERFAIRGGFLQVLGSRVTLLVTQAVRGGEIDGAKAKTALVGVLEGLQHAKSREDYDRLLDERRWWETQIRLARAS